MFILWFLTSLVCITLGRKTCQFAGAQVFLKPFRYRRDVLEFGLMQKKHNDVDEAGRVGNFVSYLHCRSIQEMLAYEIV